MIEHAAEPMAEDVQACAHTHLAATTRRKAILSMLELEKPSGFGGNAKSGDPKAVEGKDCVDKRLLAGSRAPCWTRCSVRLGPATGLVLLDDAVDGSLFLSQESQC